MTMYSLLLQEIVKVPPTAILNLLIVTLILLAKYVALYQSNNIYKILHKYLAILKIIFSSEIKS